MEIKLKIGEKLLITSKVDGEENRMYIINTDGYIASTNKKQYEDFK